MTESQGDGMTDYLFSESDGYGGMKIAEEAEGITGNLKGTKHELTPDSKKSNQPKAKRFLVG